VGILKRGKMKTAQELFDKVATHLLTQMRKSIDIHTGKCLYRAPDGAQCAVGCLFEDSDYVKEFVDVAWYLDRGYLSDYACHESLMDSLQAIHDAEDPEDWLLSLEDLALHLRLDTEVLSSWILTREVAE